MHTLTLDGKSYSLPSTWNELTPYQLFVLTATMQKCQARGETLPQLRARLLLLLLEANIYRNALGGGTVYTLQIGRARHVLTDEQVATLSTDIFSFLTKKIMRRDPQTKEKRMVEEIVCERTINPYPTLPCTCREQLQGPADGLSDITYGQYGLMMAYHAMMLSDADNRARHRDRLLATLYRKPGAAFDAARIDATADIIARTSPTYKEVLLQWVYGCLNFMAKKFPNVFAGGQPAGGNALSSHLESVDALAGEDVTKYNSVESAPLYDVLNRIELSIKNDRKKSKK